MRLEAPQQDRPEDHDAPAHDAERGREPGAPRRGRHPALRRTLHRLVATDAPLRAADPGSGAAASAAFADGVNAGIHPVGSPHELLRAAGGLDRAEGGGAFASRLGLGDVRVHRGEATQAALAKTGARGATVGGSVFVGDDDPHVLAHELAHVAQLRRRGPANSNDTEADADRVADALLAGRTASPDATLAAEAVAFYPGRITGDGVRLRAAPGGDQIGSLRRGEAVEVLDDSGGEFLHVLRGSQEGWVSRRFLERADAAPPTTSAIAPAQPATTQPATAQTAPATDTATDTATGTATATATATATDTATGTATAPATASATATATTATAQTATAQTATAARAPSLTAAAFDASADPVASLRSGTFLGVSLRAHPILLDRLAIAEQYLASQHHAEGAALRRALGVDGHYSVHRTADGYHHFGLAIDINYSSNPYVGGQEGTRGEHDRAATAAIYRAAWLTGGTDALSSQDSWRRREHGDSTDALYDHFQAGSDALDHYLRARDDASQVARWIAAGNLSRQPAIPRGLPQSILNLDALRTADAATWLEQIQRDFTATHATAGGNWQMGGTSGAQRSSLGFMNLHRDLVHALREVAGLAWGAADFGETANGDFMHFDARTVVPYAVARAALQAYRAAHH